MIAMELSHSLLLNEEALAAIGDAHKPVFVHEWLRFLLRILPVTQKVSRKHEGQRELVRQEQRFHRIFSRNITSNNDSFIFTSFSRT